MPYHEPDEACDCYWCRKDRAEAEQYLRDAAAADTHSLDVDPGGEPWES